MAVLSIVATVSAPRIAAATSLITGLYQLDYTQDTETKGADKKEVRMFKQSFELKYKGFFSPVVENEASFKVEQEVNSAAPDMMRLLPTVDLAFKGEYWDVRAGVKRTHENSDDPARNPKTTDNWFVEFFYRAPRRIPDLKAKYTLDTDFEEGATDTAKQGVILSSQYKPKDWLELKGDYSRDTTDDRRAADSDTVAEKTSGAVAVRRMISRKIKGEAQYQVEVDRGHTILDAGGSTNVKEDQTHTVKSLLSFRPFNDTALDGTYDYELKQNNVLGEHTLTTNIKGTLLQKIGKPFDVKGEFLRVITEQRHTADDNRKTEDTWTVELKAVFSKQLDFSFRRQDKHAVEDHADVTKSQRNGTVNDTVMWTGELAPFWRATASYDRIDTFTWDTVAREEAKTAIDTKYSLKTTFDFKAVNLLIDPSYDLTFKEDRVKPVNTETRDFKLKIAYKVLSTRTVEAKIDHTYGRKKDTAAQNIQRTDTTNANLMWKNMLPGWMFAIDLTRTASDTSEDDLPPDITSTFGFRADYAYEWLAINASYKYDKKSLTDDAETIDAKVGWITRDWDVSVTYTINNVLSAETDEKHSLTLTFKYNL